MRRLSLLVPSLAMVLFTSCAREPGDAAVPVSRSVADAKQPAPVAADANPDWVTEVTARMRDAQHAFVADGSAFTAEVPERGLNASFDDLGVRIADAADPGGTPIRVRSAGFGRDGAVS